MGRVPGREVVNSSVNGCRIFLQLVSLRRLAVRCRSSAQPHIVKETLGRVLLLQKVLRRDRFQHILFGRLLNLTTNQKLVQHKVSLFKVEDDVKLTHTAKVFVQEFHVSVDDLQRQKLVVCGFHRAAKVKTGIPFVDNLVIFPLEKRGHFWPSSEDGRDKLPRELLLVFLCEGSEPLLEP